jgi:hypothetical protein
LLRFGHVTDSSHSPLRTATMSLDHAGCWMRQHRHLVIRARLARCWGARTMSSAHVRRRRRQLFPPQKRIPAHLFLPQLTQAKYSPKKPRLVQSSTACRQAHPHRCVRTIELACPPPRMWWPGAPTPYFKSRVRHRSRHCLCSVPADVLTGNKPSLTCEGMAII